MLVKATREIFLLNSKLKQPFDQNEDSFMTDEPLEIIQRHHQKYFYINKKEKRAKNESTMLV